MKFEYNIKMCYNYKDPIGKTISHSGGGDAMEEFRISYKGIVIGKLLRKTEDKKVQHQFIPAQEIPQEIKDKIRVFPELLEGSIGWTEAIPVLENRIKDAKRFDADSKIVNQTDSFEIERA